MKKQLLYTYWTFFSSIPVSELRVVLLGNSSSEMCSVGNLILGAICFSELCKSVLRLSGPMEDKKITVINTPELQFLTMNKLTEFTQECARLSNPGPHVFLLVLQPKNFTEEYKERLCKVLRTFSEQSFDHSLILILEPTKGSSGLINSSYLRDMIRKCRYRYLWQSNLEFQELLTRFGQIVKENNGEHVTHEAFEEPSQTLPTLPGDHQSSIVKKTVSSAVKLFGKWTKKITIKPYILFFWGEEQ